MKAWILFTLVGSTWAGVVEKEREVTLLYADPAVSDPISMTVKVDEKRGLITYHMEQKGNMADVETMEDYTEGFAATRDAEEESCFIRRLSSNLPEAIQELEKTAASGPQKYSGEVNLLAIPSEDLNEIVGKRLTDFCGDYAMYKLTASDEEGNEGSKQDAAAERFFFGFRRCRCFKFFFFCFITSIVVPTGTTLFFFPFFWG